VHVSHPLSCTSLQINRTQWTAKNYPERAGWWHLQTLGYTFSKGHLVNTRGSINHAGPAQSKLLCTVEVDTVPVVHRKNMLGKAVWVSPASGKDKPIRRIAFPQWHGCTWFFLCWKTTCASPCPCFLHLSAKRELCLWSRLSSVMSLIYVLCNFAFTDSN